MSVILFDTASFANPATDFGSGILPAARSTRFIPTDEDEAWRLEEIARDDFMEWMDEMERRGHEMEVALLEMDLDRYAE